MQRSMQPSFFFIILTQAFCFVPFRLSISDLCFLVKCSASAGYCGGDGLIFRLFWEHTKAFTRGRCMHNICVLGVCVFSCVRAQIPKNQWSFFFLILGKQRCRDQRGDCSFPARMCCLVVLVACTDAKPVWPPPTLTGVASLMLSTKPPDSKKQSITMLNSAIIKQRWSHSPAYISGAWDITGTFSFAQNQHLF